MKLIGSVLVGLFAQTAVAKLPGFYSPRGKFTAIQTKLHSLRGSLTAGSPVKTDSLTEGTPKETALSFSQLTDQGLKILAQRLNAEEKDLLIKSS
jgi:hypothetical protein